MCVVKCYFQEQNTFVRLLVLHALHMYCRSFLMSLSQNKYSLVKGSYLNPDSVATQSAYCFHIMCFTAKTDALVAMEIKGLSFEMNCEQSSSNRLCFDSSGPPAGLAKHTKSWMHIQNGKPAFLLCRRAKCRQEMLSSLLLRGKQRGRGCNLSQHSNLMGHSWNMSVYSMLSWKNNLETQRHEHTWCCTCKFSSLSNNGINKNVLQHCRCHVWLQKYSFLTDIFHCLALTWWP